MTLHANLQHTANWWNSIFGATLEWLSTPGMNYRGIWYWNEPTTRPSLTPRCRWCSNIDKLTWSEIFSRSLPSFPSFFTRSICTRNGMREHELFLSIQWISFIYLLRAFKMSDYVRTCSRFDHCFFLLFRIWHSATVSLVRHCDWPYARIEWELL